MRPKVTIAIPTYNHSKTVEAAVISALIQAVECKDFSVEVLVSDNGSTDDTLNKLSWFDKTIRVIHCNGKSFQENADFLVKHAKGEYIVFLCDDDYFMDENVISDMVDIFEMCPNVAVVDRPYFQFIDGHSGAVASSRSDNVLVSCTNPSGIGVRKSALKGLRFSDKIYTEFPSVIKEVLKKHKHKKLTYDSVAVRLHNNNLAVNKDYYRGSLIRNWHELGDKGVVWDFKRNYLCLKNRAGLVGLLREVKENIKIEPKVLFHPAFWFFFLLSILIPSLLLQQITKFYRHRIARNFNKIIYRKHGSRILNLGCGKAGNESTINVDITDYDGVDIVSDVASKKWDIADNSIDGIHASHVIEHLPSQEDFIRECYRVLKPGGFLRLKVPHSSSPSGIGCMGHNRTYSYNTFNQYLCVPFYMFKKPLFKTVEQKLLWWYEDGDCYGNVPAVIWAIILIVNPIINFFIRLSPLICENFWWAYVGGVKEVIWKGEKI